MVKGFWRNSRASRHCGVKKRTAGKPTRERLTVLTGETFKNIFCFLEENRTHSRKTGSVHDLTDSPAAWLVTKRLGVRREAREAKRHAALDSKDLARMSWAFP